MASSRIMRARLVGKTSIRAIPCGIARALPGWKFLRVTGGRFGLILAALLALILLSPLLTQNERSVAATTWLTALTSCWRCWVQSSFPGART